MRNGSRYFGVFRRHEPPRLGPISARRPRRWLNGGGDKFRVIEGFDGIPYFNRPRRFILVRHGESEGNVDESAYVNTADWKISLTAKGRQQAAEAGRKLKGIVGDQKCLFYVSPYVRTLQTFEGLRGGLSEEQILSMREEPRIVEQQFGNFQNVEQIQQAKRERALFGRFFFRYPDGESALNVYNRVTSFVGTLFRDCNQLRSQGHDLGEYNIVIVTHGLAIRLFIMRWFQYSVADFEKSWNPPNCALLAMERTENEEGVQWFKLCKDALKMLSLPEFPSQNS